MRKFSSVFKYFLLAVMLAVLLCGCKAKETAETPNGTVRVSSVAVGDTEMRYCSFGTGSKTMVILPGISPTYVTDSAEAVAAQYAQFADDFTIYLFDIKDDIPEAYTVQEMAEDSYTAIKNLGLSDIYVFGFSMGGIQAICMDAAHPGLISRMMLCSTFCKADDIFDGIMNSWISDAQSGDGLALKKQMAKDIYSETVQEAYGSALYEGGESLTVEQLDRFKTLANTMVNLDITAEAKDMTADCYLVYSDGDRLIDGKMFAELVQYVPSNAVFEYDSSYGHAVCDEAEDFPARMLEFFEKN